MLEVPFRVYFIEDDPKTKRKSAGGIIPPAQVFGETLRYYLL
jgi:hypothetical protein